MLKMLSGLATGLVLGTLLAGGCMSALPAYTIYRQVEAANTLYELKVTGLLLRCQAQATSEGTLRGCVNAVEAFHRATGQQMVQDDDWWREADLQLEFRWTEWVAAAGDRLEARYRLWLERRGWQRVDGLAQAMVPKLTWSRPA